MKRSAAAPLVDRSRVAQLPDEALLTPEECATWLAVTVRRLEPLGVPSVRMGRRTRRYRVGSVRAYLQEHERGRRPSLAEASEG